MTNISIIGAGIMGRQIAGRAINYGFNLALYDVNSEALEQAKKYLDGVIKRSKNKEALGTINYHDILSEAVKSADLVIEAVPEDLKIKKEVFSQIEKAAPPNVIIATNSSSIPVSKIEDAVERKENLLNLHFYMPIPLRNMVDIMRGTKTNNETFEKGKDLIEKIECIPLVVEKECLRIWAGGHAVVDKAWKILDNRKSNNGYRLDSLIEHALKAKNKIPLKEIDPELVKELFLVIKDYLNPKLNWGRPPTEFERIIVSLIKDIISKIDLRKVIIKQINKNLENQVENVFMELFLKNTSIQDLNKILHDTQDTFIEIFYKIIKKESLIFESDFWLFEVPEYTGKLMSDFIKRRIESAIINDDFEEILFIKSHNLLNCLTKSDANSIIKKLIDFVIKNYSCNSTKEIKQAEKYDLIKKYNFEDFNFSEEMKNNINESIREKLIEIINRNKQSEVLAVIYLDLLNHIKKKDIDTLTKKTIVDFYSVLVRCYHALDDDFFFRDFKTLTEKIIKFVSDDIKEYIKEVIKDNNMEKLYTIIDQDWLDILDKKAFEELCNMKRELLTSIIKAVNYAKERNFVNRIYYEFHPKVYMDSRQKGTQLNLFGEPVDEFIEIDNRRYHIKDGNIDTSKLNLKKPINVWRFFSDLHVLKIKPLFNIKEFIINLNKNLDKIIVTKPRKETSDKSPIIIDNYGYRKFWLYLDPDLIRVPYILDYEDYNIRKNLINPDEAVITDEELTMVITYPLSKKVRIKLKKKGGFSRMAIFKSIYEVYKYIYEEEEREVGDPGTFSKQSFNRAKSNGTYGIWGHYLDELVIESVSYNAEKKELYMFIGS